MVRRIRAQFEMILGKNTWMDAKTKAAALKKLKAMKMNIGYPDELMDNLKLEQYYSALEVNTEEYLESMLRLEVFSTDYEYNRLRKPVNKTDWVDRDSAVKVNAGYNPSTNFIGMYSIYRYTLFVRNTTLESIDKRVAVVVVEMQEGTTTTASCPNRGTTRHISNTLWIKIQPMCIAKFQHHSVYTIIPSTDSWIHRCLNGHGCCVYT